MNGFHARNQYVAPSATDNRGPCKTCGHVWGAHSTGGFCPLREEKDPFGISQHAPGAKLDAGKNRLGLIMGGFAHALEEVGKVGTYGANKYTDHGWRSVPDGIPRYTDAMYRHLLAESTSDKTDGDTGLLHAAHAAWNALARLELMLSNAAQVGPGAPEAGPASRSSTTSSPSPTEGSR